MKLSDLQSKDIININDGKLIGRVIDADITLDGKINYLVIEEKRGFSNLLNRVEEINLYFNQIKTIGTDVILVEL
jgi:YlmC/YmxH family sporulation protein